MGGRGIGTAMRSSIGTRAGADGPRPMTAVRGAGYTSEQGAGRSTLIVLHSVKSP